MTVQRHQTLTALALAGLVAACGEPAGPDSLLSPNARGPQAKLVPSGAPLQVKAEYEVELVDEQSMREHVEMTAYFSADPIDPETGLPMEDISFNFAKTEYSYTTNEKDGSMGGSVSFAWKPHKRDGSYEFEATDPQAVLDAVKIQVFEEGQAVADVTGYIREVSGKLLFNPNFKIWELRLGFTSVDLPSGIVTPTMLKTLGGSSIATLNINQTELTTPIRENEFSAQSAELVLNAETKIQDAGAGNVQEVFEINTNFFSSELNPFAAVDVFLKLEFEINYPGVVGPPCLQIAIPPGAWVQGDGGGFKMDAPEVPHEMILVRLKEGVTLPQVLEAASAGGDPGEFTEGGAAILIASPGDTAGTRMLVDLLPGRTYALVCNFEDGEGKPPHVVLGMAKSIEVDTP